jgi:murein tripeptide amidase MpaA
MKLYYLSLFSTVLAMGAAASPSADDRSDALLRHRPSGTFRVIDASRQHNRHLQSQNYTTVHNHPCFRDLQGMTQAMFDLQNEYSHLVSISDIGDSYLKSIDDNDGHDIYVMEITASPNSTTSSQVFMVGGQHAREMAPPELLMRYAEQLVQGYDRDADITWILDTTQINIVLYVNPDGREVAETQHDALWWWWWGGYIRKNVNPGNVRCIFESYGVDLNRNYDWMWGGEGGASSAPCDEMYHGVEPESEPEVRAVVDYAKSIFPEGQRKVDPVKEMDVPYGENVTGLFVVS